MNELNEPRRTTPKELVRCLGILVDIVREYRGIGRANLPEFNRRAEEFERLRRELDISDDDVA